MPENERFENWPYCPVCDKPMVMTSSPVTGSFCNNPDCGKELPPLGVNVSDTSGVAGKVG